VVKVAVADDSALFRGGLAMMLDAAGVDVVAQAASGGELLAMLRHPDTPVVDAVILDIRMPPSFTDEGILAAHEVRRWSPGMGVLVLSTYAETECAVRLLAEGSAGVGYLLKDHVDEIGTLRDALERVVAGESVVDPQIVQRLMHRGGLPATERLTERERVVLTLMAEGRSNSGIADRLCVSQKTVEGHVNNIFSRLGLGTDRDDNRRVLAVLSWLRTLDDA
jgi:DNA-binding NarL/FixJ family response regulator